MDIYTHCGSFGGTQENPRATNGLQEAGMGSKLTWSDFTYYQFCVFDPLTAYYFAALPALRESKGSTVSVYIHNLYSFRYIPTLVTN